MAEKQHQPSLLDPPEEPGDRLPPMDSPAPDKNPNPLATVPPLAVIPADPLAMISTAMESGAIEPATLKELVDMMERREDRLAVQAFNKAMADFQAECPIISKNKRAEIKSKKGAGSSYGYNYAGYAFIMQEIKPLLNVCGLSLSFSSTKEGGPARIACKVSHRDGHSQTTTFDCPMPANMQVNDTQKMGAALTYGRRYALVSALNIVVAGEDDDAACVRPGPVEPQQQDPHAPHVKTRGERNRTMPDVWACFQSKRGSDEWSEEKKLREFWAWAEMAVYGGAPIQEGQTMTDADLRKAWEALNDE